MDTIFRCSFCGWNAVLAESDVTHDSRCHACQTGRLLRVDRPTEDEWDEGVGLA